MAVLLSGCYEEFTPETDVNPVLCVNSLITAGEPIEVRVSRTHLYTEDNFADYSVKDAEVRIYANGELKGADYIPQEGDDIRIEVQSSRYGTAEAEVKVPESVPAKSLSLRPLLLDEWRLENPDGSMAGGISFNLGVDMEIDDPGAVENYYRLSILGFNYGGEADDEESSNATHIDFSPGEFKYEAEPIFGEHIGVFDSVMGNDNFGFTFFTDRQFSGSSYTLHLVFNNGRYSFSISDGWQSEYLDCGLILTLHTVSQSYYNWVNYLWQRDDGILGDINNIGFGDPMWGYSNVSTGAGVVAAQSCREYIVSLREFIESVLKKDY